MLQVDTNWYEGERNAMLGIFPTTYVDILPQDTVVSQVTRTTCAGWLIGIEVINCPPGCYSFGVRFLRK